jgi:hypothetical protein
VGEWETNIGVVGRQRGARKDDAADGDIARECYLRIE